MGGSLLHDVSVPTDKSLEGIKIIEDDLRQRRYYIILYAEGREVKYAVPEDRWRESEPRTKYQELLARGGYPASSDLGAVLKATVVTDVILAFPYVMRIKSLEREYMVSQKKIQRAHEYRIVFAVAPDRDIGGADLHFQVWDSGRQILCRGPHEWWCGTPDTVALNQSHYDKRKAVKAPKRVAGSD